MDSQRATEKRYEEFKKERSDEVVKKITSKDHTFSEKTTNKLLMLAREKYKMMQIAKKMEQENGW